MSNSLVRGMDLDVMKLGEVFARSGYFKDASDPAKAIVKILYGAELGIGPVAAMMGIYIVEGKPAPSAGLMAAMVKRSRRYDYRVKRSDAQAAIIDFFQNGEVVGASSFTIAEAQAAKLTGRDNWTKYPKAMLFNRAMSQGVPMFCPDLFGGVPVYDAEELGAEVDADGEVISEAAAERIAVEEVRAHRREASATIPHPQVQRTQAALERVGSYAETVIDVPPYPGAEAARCSECRRALTAGQWLFSHKAKGRPLCPTCQKATAQARAEDVVGVASDELEMEVDPGGGTAVEDRVDDGEIPPAFR